MLLAPGGRYARFLWLTNNAGMNSFLLAEILTDWEPSFNMKLWTIQTEAAWVELQKEGRLIANEEYIFPEWLSAYEWLNKQMETRLGTKPDDVKFPIWAWYQWRDAKQRRPDLRCRAHLAPGEKGVLLECNISDHLVLLSDFHLWHYVLNHSYLAENEQQGLLFEEKILQKGVSLYEKPFFDNELNREVTDSWYRIFDLDWIDETGYVTIGNKAEKAIQATFWELRLEQVRKVKPFVAR
jgi:hypothetical protein